MIKKKNGTSRIVKYSIYLVVKVLQLEGTLMNGWEGRREGGNMTLGKE